MRQQHLLRLLSGAAFLALASLSGAAPSFAEEKAAVEESKPFDFNSVNSFSGAFLAARTADVDHDLDTATKLYRTALEFEPDNVDVKQRLMITSLMNGDFNTGAKIAEELKNDSSVERITTITRAVEAIRKREYRHAQKILNYEGPNDLDRLMNGLLLGWAKAGEGKPKDAIADIQKMEGPDWFRIFKSYNQGAIALAAGDKSTARSKLNDAVLDREGGAAAPDTFMRAVIALAKLEARDGNKQKALDAVSVGEGFISNYAPAEGFAHLHRRGQTAGTAGPQRNARGSLRAVFDRCRAQPRRRRRHRLALSADRPGAGSGKRRYPRHARRDR